MPISLVDDQDDNREFGDHQEKAIIALALDHPDFFSHVAQYLKPDMFTNPYASMVYHRIHEHYVKHGVIITRQLCKDELLSMLSADDDWKPCIEILDYESNPREIKILRDQLVSWAKSKAYDQLYTTDSIEAAEQGDYSHVDQIVEDARKITDFTGSAFWFFDQAEELFVDEMEKRYTTGFDYLDTFINAGGPAVGEVFCWTAPTGVGKSLMLVNSAYGCLKMGAKVLFITLELSAKKVAERFLGVISGQVIRRKHEHRDIMLEKVRGHAATYGKNLVIEEFAPDDISVDTIYAICDARKKQKDFDPDVIVIDYLELLLSRNPSYNKEDYTRQKRVATEIRQLARKQQALCFTASQTNRSGIGSHESGKAEESIGLSKIAESYGKTMPMEYIVTINQTANEYRGGRTNPDDEDSPNLRAKCRFYIAKNRNGIKFKSIDAHINYETMRATDEVHE